MTMPVAEGGQTKSGPNWLMIGGAAAGIIGLILILKSGSSSTTAAGTSINAALGSIQEQNMNLLGQQSKDTAAISGQISDMEKTLQDELNALNGNVIISSQATQTLQQAFWARQMADYTYMEAGPSDPRVQQWIDYANKLFSQYQTESGNVTSDIGAPAN